MNKTCNINPPKIHERKEHHAFNFQGITKIADLTACSNLTVLYLYNNKLKAIEALDSAPHIQLLYLQNNKISRMGGLEKLKKLKKLYLTRNKIQVLEGLLENRCLEVCLTCACLYSGIIFIAFIFPRSSMLTASYCGLGSIL